MQTKTSCNIFLWSSLYTEFNVVYVVKEVRHSGGGFGQLMGVGRKSTLELLCTEKQYEYQQVSICC